MASRIEQPMKREESEPTPRRAFTTAQHRTILERQDWRCNICGQRERAYQFDHILPIELGGEHTLGNAQALCLICHRHKSAVDIRRIAKARRLRHGPKPSKYRIKSRGFQTALTRGFDGKVRER